MRKKEREQSAHRISITVYVYDPDEKKYLCYWQLQQQVEKNKVVKAKHKSRSSLARIFS